MLKGITQEEFENLLDSVNADMGILIYFDSANFPKSTDIVMRAQGDLEFIYKAMDHCKELLRQKLEGRKPRIIKLDLMKEQ